MPDTSIPTITDSVKQQFSVEPLGGPRDVFYYLDRFPEELYNKSPDSHLYKFMRTVLGENGVNWVKKNHLEARLSLEDMGIDMFDLDAFFGSPFDFGRIAGESLDDDIYQNVSREDWERINAKNSRYRNRALDYLNGARAGNTPQGMQLVAKAGLGHDVAIIENYKYLFDQHSDDALGLTYYGKTTSTEEMIVLPRREVGISEVQRLTIVGDPDPPTGGSFYLRYNGINSNLYEYYYADGNYPVDVPASPDEGDTYSGYKFVNGVWRQIFTSIPWYGTRDHVKLALEAIPAIGEGNVEVSGGPGPLIPWEIKFVGDLADRDVPDLEIFESLTPNVPNNTIRTRIVTLTGGSEASDEVIDFPAADQYSLQSALDRIKPMTTIPTLARGAGIRERTNWKEASASSEYSEVTRYVTGTPNITWPAVKTNTPYWIVSDVEKQAPRLKNDLQYHYTGFHNVQGIESSTNNLSGSTVTPQMALADYAEPLFVTSADDSTSYVNGIYPTDYRKLNGVPTIQYDADRPWESIARTDDEWLTLSFSSIKAVNYLSFDISRNPVQIDVEYDLDDGSFGAQWQAVSPVSPYSNIISTPLDQAQNTWASLGLTFTNSLGQMIYTRSVRIKFVRLNYAGTIKLRNLRVARNVG